MAQLYIIGAHCYFPTGAKLYVTVSQLRIIGAQWCVVTGTKIYVTSTKLYIPGAYYDIRGAQWYVMVAAICSGFTVTFKADTTICMSFSVT